MGSCATKCCATKCCGKTPEIETIETPVFADNKYDFRIPALIYVKEWKTFLAFAEKRTSTDDAHARNLVMRKGTRQTDGSLQWSPTEDLMTALKPGYRTMNPCPVFERKSRTLILFFICIEGNIPEGHLKPGQTRLCYITSTNCGKTWRKVTDLTSSVNFTDYQTFAVGPGHGIQLSSGPLLVPAYVKVNCGTSGVKSYSVVLRSEDMNNWKAGQPITWKAGQHLDMESGECQLAEVCDGEGGKTQVYLNARSTKADDTRRVEALSDDSGESFQPLKKLMLKEANRCQGSVLGFPARELPAGEGGSSETALLFSHPTTEDRQDLVVYLRKCLQDQDPDPWGEHLIIHPGPSGYSDLSYCEEESHFGCLMESGFGEKSHRFQIAFREFDLKEIV